MVNEFLMLATQLAAPGEAELWPAVECAAPQGVALEVGGLLPLAAGELLACTRRGEVWRIERAWTGAPKFSLWCDGLQEPLGLLAHEGWVWTAQRGELTRMRDADGDGRADDFEIFCDAWPTSGDYHEYAFGPALDRDGNFWITLNRPFGAQAFGPVDWRGWAMRIGPDGAMTPVCAGLRSPAGVGAAPWGTMFYTDNQGEWCGASKLAVLQEGDFHGHPWGIESARLPASRVEHPGEPVDGMLMPEAAQTIPHFRLPAVWFPYDVMGRSPSGFAWDETGGAFGPFAGQLFVGDQYQASVMRVFLEEVAGVWQGTCFPFRRGLLSGVIRVAFDEEGGLVVGMSDRGWPALGTQPWGLQRLSWNGVTPFEILAVRARPEGFRVEFTRPADPATLTTESFTYSSWTYEWHSAYGSEPFETRTLAVTAAQPQADGLAVELTVAGLREGYVHALLASGVRDAAGAPLLHPQAYTTLIKRPAR
jgi:hypothetical protein